MISGLRGSLTKIDVIDNYIWLDVNGIIYEIIIPQYLISQIESLINRDEIFIYTYYHVSERNPSPILVGFLTETERNFFKKFLSVPGFGPVKAVRLLSIPIEEIIILIENKDTEGLIQLQGIGLQIANTIIAKLNGKLIDLIPDDYQSNAINKKSIDPIWNDAVDALISLDFNKKESENVINKIRKSNPDAKDLESILRMALEAKF
ncbi:MAG: OB-fold domain-containing protein [Dehalococcoidia bacterium]|jgi:Holliday junction DNA helicase RuvA|nr:MAG: holliday junction DNA helicase RuvA [Chloroflexota bacterium]|tara:strand:- start:1238 stop:1855 length:618 start_codon:yes stop_codon:yes gene_type:complete